MIRDDIGKNGAVYLAETKAKLSAILALEKKPHIYFPNRKSTNIHRVIADLIATAFSSSLTATLLNCTYVTAVRRKKYICRQAHIEYAGILHHISRLVCAELPKGSKVDKRQMLIDLCCQCADYRMRPYKPKAK